MPDQQGDANPAETEPVHDGPTEAEEADHPGDPPTGLGIIFLAPPAG
ncbi:MAG TPA: hypothetical protein VLJ59_02575 [Mycobacteriales bacterium]|nr:hypothetical protein [Mycobacteriales bacterium]